MSCPDPRTPAIVTIGNFDGVHLGHQKLLGQVAERAWALELCSFAITFAPHPRQVLFPETRHTSLSTPEERVELLHAHGIDDVWVCPFTTELARLEPEDFIRMVIERQAMAELWIGSDFALGRGRRGTIAVLSEIAGAMGWGLHMVPPYSLEGQVVSSTAIRTLLAAGAFRGAADLLGRPYSVPADLVGDELRVDPLRALPRPMRYDALLHQSGKLAETVVTVLSNPARVIMDHDSCPHHDGEARIEFVRRSE
jgi:riboflavin kinase/FMN adenylyltransferase